MTFPSRIAAFRKNFEGFVSVYWRTIIVFLVSTALMLWQHSMGWNWDLNVYSMNAEYLFHVGNYIEWQRPIVVPTILSVLQYFFTRGVSEYVFVALSNSFFYLATYQSSKSFDIDFEVFYILLMSPLAISIGSFHGTEMLSLAFVMLFFSEIYRKRSGIWMSLAFLTRNTNFILIPFGLMDRDGERLFKKFGIAAIPVLIWLGCNWAVLGDPFSAVANRIAINFYENPHNFPIKPLTFLKIPAISLIFIGAYIFKKRPEISLKGFEKVDLMMITYSGYIAVKYLAVDLRQTRFLYPLIFTSAYFAVKSYDILDLSRHVLTGVLVFNLVFAGFLVADTPVSNSGGFERAAEHIDVCRAESDVWPQLAYAGAPATKPLEPELTAYRIRNGWRAVFFNPDEYFKNSSLQQTLPKLEQNPSYVVYGTGECIESHVVNSTYLEKKRELDRLRGEEGVYEPTRYIIKNVFGFTVPPDFDFLWVSSAK
jgi:hypothetical protein